MCDKHLYSMHIESNLLKQSPVLKGHLYIAGDFLCRTTFFMKSYYWNVGKDVPVSATETK
jgi:hypothetical protein